MRAMDEMIGAQDASTSRSATPLRQNMHMPLPPVTRTSDVDVRSGRRTV
jgi:hypothetical protein